MQVNNEDRTLNELLGFSTISMSQGQSYLVRRIDEICKMPISHLDVGDHRLLISQNIGLKYIMPLAINFLSNDLFLEGDYYPGDLLKAILTVDNKFWEENHDLRGKVKLLCTKGLSEIHNVEVSNSIKSEMNLLLEKFAR